MSNLSKRRPPAIKNINKREHLCLKTITKIGHPGNCFHNPFHGTCIKQLWLHQSKTVLKVYHKALQRNWKTAREMYFEPSYVIIILLFCLPKSNK